MESKIKPCPFCGSEDVKISSMNDGTPIIACMNDLCRATVMFPDKRDEFLKAWNSRPLGWNVGYNAAARSTPEEAIMPYKKLRACPFCANALVWQLYYEVDTGKMPLPMYVSAVSCAECSAYVMFANNRGQRDTTDRWNLRNGQEGLF
ncbi:MAG: Lar family restriction alleviation protein [Bacteroidales bacterium]|nr:Lar family restriction alleviation protein [Bacteroidales bacterium]